MATKFDPWRLLAGIRLLLFATNVRMESRHICGAGTDRQSVTEYQLDQYQQKEGPHCCGPS
jgi:hypothetical protein